MLHLIFDLEQYQQYYDLAYYLTSLRYKISYFKLYCMLDSTSFISHCGNTLY